MLFILQLEKFCYLIECSIYNEGSGTMDNLKQYAEEMLKYYQENQNLVVGIAVGLVIFIVIILLIRQKFNSNMRSRNSKKSKTSNKSKNSLTHCRQRKLRSRQRTLPLTRQH